LSCPSGFVLAGTLLVKMKRNDCIDGEEDRIHTLLAVAYRGRGPGDGARLAARICSGGKEVTASR
jgi:hypothetical protein